jgi:branched-chain amino acid transport system substrate-binding protein
MRALLLFVILLATAIGTAQDRFVYDAGAEVRFQTALGLFSSAKYAEAAAIFDSLSDRIPMHQRTTAASVMLAKARFALGEYQESVRSVAELFKKVPETSYADDARFTLGLDYMMLRRYDEAVVQFLRSAELATDTALFLKSVALFESLAERRLDDKALEELLPRVRTEELKDLVILNIAEKEEAAGDTRRARALLRGPLARLPSGRFHARLLAMDARLRERLTLKIGAILPLMKGASSHPLQSVAEEMLEGIRFALREATETTLRHASISLDVRDTGRDSLQALEAVNAFGADESVVGIIGPLFSNLAAGCAAVANRVGIPLVSPTAAANGIAATGRYVFQASPDYAVRGRGMASYAVRRLGYTSLAVLASAEPMGRALAESFIAEATSLGATIVAAQFYAKGVSDLREQFIGLRTAAIARAGGQDKPDDLEVPIDNIQGVFIPVSGSDEIGVLGAQMKYFNVNTQLLGSSEWNDPVQLDEHKRYLNGAIFTGDTFLDEDDSLSYGFLQAYTAASKTHPSKYALFGYDTMRMILAQIAAGASTRTALAEALRQVEGFHGVHGTISLRPTGVNSDVMVLKYVNGEILKLEDVAVH